MNTDALIERQEEFRNQRTIERIENALINLRNFLGDVEISDPVALESVIAPRAKEFEIIANELFDSFQIFRGEAREILEELLQQNISDINNPFYRIKGLVDHDIKKSFILHMGYISIIQEVVSDGIIAQEEYASLSIFLGTMYTSIPESLNILNLLKKYRDATTSVNLGSLPNAIGFRDLGNGTNEFISAGDESTIIHLDKDLLVETPEILFTVSTLILNAKAEKAKGIDIQVTDSGNTIEISVLDNSTEGVFPPAFIRDIQASFEAGMQNPYKPLDGSRGGGKLAAFLAGQRYALANPLAKVKYNPETFSVIEGTVDNMPAKGFRITIDRKVMLLPLSTRALNYELTHIEYITKLLVDNSINDNAEYVGDYINSFRINLKNQDCFTNLLLACYPENEVLHNISHNVQDKLEELLTILVEQLMKGMPLNINDLGEFINFVNTLVVFSTNPNLNTWANLNEYLDLPIEMEGVA